MPRTTASKYWVYTINNPEEEDNPTGWEWSEQPKVVYSIWQLEIGECGTPHYQGYCVLEQRAELSGVKKLSDRAHWEPRRPGANAHAKAVAYCSKEDTRADGPWEIGRDTEVPDGPGKRNDLLALKQAVDEGRSEAECFDVAFGSMLRYYRAVREYRLAKAKPRDWMPEVFVYYGDTGIGKSRECHERYPGAFWKLKPAGTDWWDGYCGQSVIVIDEFYGWLPWQFLLRLLDRYPMRFEIRGGSVENVARTVVLTSNIHPSEWYQYGVRMRYPTLRRRLSKIFTRVSMDDEWLAEDDDCAIMPTIQEGNSSRVRTYVPVELQVPRE